MAPGVARGVVVGAQDLEGEIDQPRRTRLSIGFEVGKAFGRVAVEIVIAGVDQPLEVLPRRPVLVDGGGQRFDDGMAPERAALVHSGDGLAPPFEADPAEGWFRDPFAHPCNLVVEGVERE